MKHVPQIDALRGIAILMVLVGHIAKDAPALHLLGISHYCFAGVDLFFVLSGFLITSILLAAKGSERFLLNFYTRRALRIWPLYFAVMALWLVATIAAPSLHRSIVEQTHPQWAYLLFVQNLVVPQAGTFGPLQITWSLAVEEQFYLLWPLLVLLCDRKWLIHISSAAVAVSVLARLGSDVGCWHLDTYHNTLCRLDAIACGCLIALLEFRNVHIAKRAIPVSLLLIIAGQFALYLYPLGCAMLFSSLLVIAKDSQHAFWANRFLIHTGKISYGLYMLHLIAYDSVRRLFAHHSIASDLLLSVLSITGAYLIAEVSWGWYERPFLRMKALRAVPSASRASSALPHSA